MPFIDEENTLDLKRRADFPKGFAVTPGAEDLEPNGPEMPSWNWAAAFRRNNELSAMAASESRDIDNEPEPGFNPWEQIKGSTLEPLWEHFVEVRNSRKFEAVKRDIARETEDRKLLDSQPWWMGLITEGAASIISPTTLIPGGAFVRGAKGGLSIARSALSVSTAAVAGTAVQEALLQQAEQTRTAGESAVAIGGAALLGGLLGATGASLLSKGEWTRGVDGLNRQLGGEVPARAAVGEPSDIPLRSAEDVGAAATTRASADDLSIAGRAAGGLAAATEALNPALRMAQSPSPITRETSARLIENGFYLKQNMEGMTQGAAIETLMKEWNGGLGNALRATDDAYKAARKDGYAGSHQQFREEVGKAMRRADTHQNPHVDRVAKAWRGQVIEPLKEGAIKAELLPADVKVETAPSYFSRMWNRNRIIRQEPAFRSMIVDWVEQNAPRWAQEFDRETSKLTAKLETDLAKAKAAQNVDAKKLEEMARKIRDLETERRVDRDSRFGDEAATREFGSGIADELFNTFTGKNLDGDLRPEFLTITSRGPLKERTFNIQDLFVSRDGVAVEQFLEHDVALVGRRYTRIMGADIELKNKFGDVNMTEQLKGVRDSYAEMRNGITDEKQLAKLTKSETDDIRDLTAMRDLLRGTYNPAGESGNWAAITRSANAFNYIRSMGEVVLASLTDAVRPAMVHGLRQFMADIPQFVTNLKGIRASLKEANLAGNVQERVLAQRMGTLTEVIDPHSGRGPVESFLAKMTDVASTWNGIRIWTEGMQSIASVMTQNRVLDNVSRYGEVKAKERSYLAFLGIDQRMSERIAAQFAEHGDTIDRVRVANTTAWTDEAAVRAYRAAINKDIDSIIVQKSVGDVPLFAHTPTGRMLLQFKTFALASHQRVLLRSLQEDQARFVGGMIAMTTMGMFITWAKAMSGNRSEKLEDFSKNPGWWVAEGLDRSGILSVPMELSNMFEKASATAGKKFNPIKAGFTAFDEGSAISQKMQGRNLLGAVAGPTGGLIEDLAMGGAGVGVMAATGEDISQSRRNAAERLLPFNSYLGMRQMLRYVANPPD